MSDFMNGMTHFQVFSSGPLSVPQWAGCISEIRLEPTLSGSEENISFFFLELTASSWTEHGTRDGMVSIQLASEPNTAERRYSGCVGFPFVCICVSLFLKTSLMHLFTYKKHRVYVCFQLVELNMMCSRISSFEILTGVIFQNNNRQTLMNCKY